MNPIDPVQGIILITIGMIGGSWFGWLFTSIVLKGKCEEKSAAYKKQCQAQYEQGVEVGKRVGRQEVIDEWNDALEGLEKRISRIQ